jgi:O-antigen ligase
MRRSEVEIDLPKFPRRYIFESFVLFVVFSASWIGFGNYMAGVLLVAFIFALCFNQKRRFIIDALKNDKLFFILLLLFVLNNVVSSLLSVNKSESVPLSILWFLLIFIPVSYLRFSLNEENDFFVRTIVPAGLCIGIVITIYLVFCFIQGIFITGLAFKRYTFITLGKASTPDVIVMLSGIGYGWIRQRNPEKNGWVGFLYLCLCLFGCFLSFDRGGVMAMFMVMILLLSFDVKKLIVLLVLVGIVIYLSYHISALKRIQHMFVYIYSKTSLQHSWKHTQLATFRAAWGMIKDHWLMGVGTNNFSRFVTQYGTGTWYTYAHNFVLQFWAENGLFGMLLGLSIIGTFVYKWVKILRSYRYKYLALGMGASFIGLLIGNLSNSTLWLMKIAIPFWLLAGVINAMYLLEKKDNIAKVDTA